MSGRVVDRRRSGNTLYISGQVGADASGLGEARDEIFTNPPYPPSTLIVAAALAQPEILVEIEAIAVLSD